ncbi:hypothetical protein [uncultured Neisseria sp.]|uniref:hypothetical protein n=1 Tax=uncultured Neisseria sp. TaxID=237778 RepID=UPI0025E36DB9|nr:hypothetical protein [uncultured Neisseria sp.]
MKTQHKPLNHLKPLGLATQPTLASRSPHGRVCAVRTHAFSIFSATPTHCVRALRHTPYRWIQRSSEKTLAAFVPSAFR